MKSNRFYVIAVSAVAALGGFLFGFDSGVINGTVDALNRAFHTSHLGSGFNVASILLGCAAGAFIAGALADKLGRRAVLIVAAVLFVWASWGTGIAHGSLEFIAYRVMGGLAVGAASIICPAYISEIAPARIRGRLASLQQLAIVLGLFFAFLSNYFLAGAAGAASASFWLGFKAWQWMFWIEIIPSVIFLVGLLLIPESPRFLVAARRTDAARKVLTRLGEPQVDDKVRDIQDSLDRGYKPRMSDLYDREAHGIHPVLWVGIGLAAFQQLADGLRVEADSALKKAAKIAAADGLNDRAFTVDNLDDVAPGKRLECFAYDRTADAKFRSQQRFRRQNVARLKTAFLDIFQKAIHSLIGKGLARQFA